MPSVEARVSVFDRGFLHGDGCFETIRIHRGAPFRFAAHRERLDESLGILRIGAPPALTKIPTGARALVEALSMDEGLLRITVTPGTDDGPRGSVVITARPLPDVPREVVLRVADRVRRVPGPLSRCKTTSRAAEEFALREARHVGAFDAILLNPSGNAVETTARNLFVVHGGRIETPPASEGALEGITRAAVLELAKAQGLLARETAVSVESLGSADEVFLTGSGVGVLGVSRIGDERYEPAPGPTTARLAIAYGQVLDAESKW